METKPLSTFVRGKWTCTVWPGERLTKKIIARHESGRAVMHVEKLTDADIEAFDPDRRWARV